MGRAVNAVARKLILDKDIIRDVERIVQLAFLAVGTAQSPSPRTACHCKSVELVQFILVKYGVIAYE